MQITYIGHAGFYVETESTVIIMDPWLSRYGAFDSSWFQYPQNSHLFDVVLQKFEQTPKDKYIYISHEHKDHFDIEFLQAIKNRNFKIILADFKRSVVSETLDSINYQCEKIIRLHDEESFKLNDGWLKLFIVDAELDCDSAILLKLNSGCFLNVNDCKIYDRFEHITQQYGPIDVFASQFSGAIWHPVCYDMPKADYERVSNQKKRNKFRAVSSAVETINPTVFLPSAGPPCFLDPMLMHINFEESNIFPRAPAIIHYLDTHCKAKDTVWPEIMPGDVLDVATSRFIHLAEERVRDEDFKQYIHHYAQEYADYFAQREHDNQLISVDDVFIALGKELEEKLSQMNEVTDGITSCLYWRLKELPNRLYRINFHDKSMTITHDILETDHYWTIEAPAWQVHKVLSKQLNWPDFVLTFRVKLKRTPDIYNQIIHGFIALDACELGTFCKQIATFHANKERTTIEINGKKYSILRWCPHLGGDLSQGWEEDGYWVCPRHHWHFDVCHNQGQCISSNETIEAKCLTDER